MQAVKNAIVTFLQLVLWLTFIAAIQDPGILSARSPESVYNTYGLIIDALYAVTGWVVAPVQGLFELVGLYDAAAPDTWFPLCTAPELASIAPDYLQAICTPTLFAGALILWVPVTSVLLSILSPIVGVVYERVRNDAWNLIVEYGFHKKNSDKAQEELDKKKSDFDRLNAQYKALARETHTLKDSVITDELTALFNKRFFLNRLQQDFAACKKEKCYFSLIMIDIDFFKKLNDSYGHLAGDTVLKGVATVIKRVTPQQCYPCRYGGEEFSVILPTKTREESLLCAQQIQEQVQLLRFNEIDPNLRISVSQGICTVNFALPENRNIKAFEDVVQLADQELYRSKMEGRNRTSSKAL